ncbi:hypothetical protein CW751_02025 [Brumimicrobium salinarum]|uniref:Right handed beta helix domain-containing protein n=1 Tax=Brumimicrobium salinarum TaxID=2058658 RepID=A0A2I0R6F6_9FLAO|nr:right-handed parallel beta-helix repeat-containing protein [Brumimicrobium salinarum]PKR82139.1 hypothetical protein CW751_02025 [Brumimicrobium salinarum]
MNRYILYTLLFLGLMSFSSCKKKKVIKDLPSGVIENMTFKETVLIDGHGYDGTIIRNCVFEDISGDGLQIRDVNNLIIEDCIFRNIEEDAIRFRNSGSSDGVQILNNQIYNIKENGILAPEGHVNTVIKNNIIHNVATSNISSQFGSPHHGIYFQGFNVKIEQNTIYDVINDNGNGISIRTYGTIVRNKLYRAKDHGISYFSDHPGDAKQLLIENNVIFDNGKRGIHLASNGETANHIGSALVRFNTIVSNTESTIGINDDLSNVTVDLLANILIRTDGGSTYIYANVPFNQEKNITSNGNLGFVDFSNRNLRLTNASSAINYAVGLTDFPSIDFDGNTRTIGSLDAGAFENQ